MFIKDSFNYEIKKYFNKNYQYWYQASWTAASAGLGSLITEAFFDREPKTFIINILQVGLWFGIIGAFILIGVYISQKKLQHLNVDYLEISKEVIFPGFCAGFCAGSIAQILFSFYQTDLNKIICWGVAGLILAYIISKKFKNVDIKSCTIYGALGGVIGGFLFILISNIITDVMGRLIGISLIGLSICLSILVAQNKFRKCWLDVIWDTNEKFTVNLGDKEILMGSGKQVDIYLPKEKGYPEITGIFYIENGLIFVDDKLKNEKRKLEPNNVIDLEIMKIKVNAIS